jgi:hypothetical protein
MEFPVSEPLSMWNPGPARDAVLAFLARVTDSSARRK